MTAKARKQRLVKLYASLERVHAAELHAAQAAVDEVTRSADEHRAYWHQTRRQGSLARAEGDDEAHGIAGAVAQSITARLGQLTQVAASREDHRMEAEAQFSASRVRAAQMARLFERAAHEAGVDAARREQAASDDRFAARLQMKPG